MNRHWVEPRLNELDINFTLGGMVDNYAEYSDGTYAGSIDVDGNLDKTDMNGSKLNPMFWGASAS